MAAAVMLVDLGLIQRERLAFIGFCLCFLVSASLGGAQITMGLVR